MGIAEEIGKLIGSGVGSLVKDVGDTVDQFVTTGEDRAAWDLKQKELELSVKKLALEAETLLVTDRQSARQMYEHDSSLQKLFALIFLTGYLAITGVLIWLVIGWLGVQSSVDLPAWGVSLISMVFTGMSTKVNTIVDFLFGGSKQTDNSGAIAAEVNRRSTNEQENIVHG